MARKPLEIEGFQSGRLTVLRRNPYDKNLAVCRCACGRIVNARIDNLRGGMTKSCGCLRSEHARSVYQKNFKRNYEEMRKYKTNFHSISGAAPRKNNTSGRTGVYYNYRTHRWIAKICVQGNMLYLGSFDNFDDAVSARYSAEEQYFKPLIRARSAAMADK